MKTKRIVSLVLALLMMFGTVAMTAAAEPEDAAEAIVEGEVILDDDVMIEENVDFNEETVAEEETGFNEDVFVEECADELTTAFAEDTMQSEEAAVSTQIVYAQADGKASFFQIIIDWFKQIFGYYNISNETKLQQAAREGGDKWKLTKNIPVSSYVLVEKDLTINGNGHKITRENGEINGPAENIFVVDHAKTLTLKNMTLKAMKCQGIRVRTSAMLNLEACTVETNGDGIENYGFTQVSGGTNMKTTGPSTAAIWNRRTDKNEIGTATLYYCSLVNLQNDGVLNLEQDNSEIARATSAAGSKINMKAGHIGTLTCYDCVLNKTGGKIDTVDNRHPTKTNEQTIYDFLKGTMKVNTAVACGVLANIKAESNFDPTSSCIDSNGKTSYGICQWNGGRFTALRNYCASKGLDYSDINAQLQYLKHELEETGEKSNWGKVNGQSNTADGAYAAGYNWAKHFERCASGYWESRAASAKNTYWPKYK